MYRVLVSALKLTFLAFVAVAGAYTLALLWWRLWMYKGFPGPVPFIHWFKVSDGEGSYALTEVEMFLHVLLVIFLLSGFVFSLKKSRARHQQMRKTDQAKNRS